MRVVFNERTRMFGVSGSDWKYVKPLEKKDAIDIFQKKYNVSFPEDLDALIRENNGGRPPKCLLQTKNGREVAFKTLLSFNRKDAENIYDFMPLDEVKGAVPFATDPFGNLFCLYKGSVYFYDHETGEMDYVADNVTEMFANAKSSYGSLKQI